MRRQICVYGLILLLFLTFLSFPVKSAAITVCASGCDYTTIKDGVDNAGPGDTILVGAGTFVENGRIDITKNLTIIGAGVSNTIIRPNFDTALVAKTNTPSGPDESFFYVAPNVTFKMTDVTIDGDGWKIHIAIQSRGSITIEDCVIKNIRHQQFWGRGIAIYSGTQNSVKRCMLSNIERISVFVRGSWFSSNPFALIEGNTIVGKGEGNLFNYGIELGGGGQAVIMNNTISNIKGIGSGRWDSAGILATTYYGSGTKATVFGNTIIDSSFGIHVGYNSQDTSEVEAHCNTIMNNVTGIHSMGSHVNASNNWWGSDSGPFHAALNPSGTGNPVSDNVTFAPWETSFPPCHSPKKRTYPFYLISLRPLAETNIGNAEGTKGEVENLLRLAEERGLDTTRCKPFYENGLKYLEQARKFLQGNNFTPSNNHAIFAENEFKKAIDCLEALLG